MRYLLSVDIGTTSLKSCIISDSGEILASHSHAYPLVTDGSCIEQDPKLWWDAFCTTSRMLVHAHPYLELACIVLSGQMQDLIVIDADDNVMGNAILYSDTRAKREFEEYSQGFGLKRAIAITKNTPDAASIPPKLLHLRSRLGSLEGKRFLLGAHDYLTWCLCGVMVTDLTNAATTGLLEYEAHRYSPEILSWVGIEEEQLPVLEPRATVSGHISAAAAKLCGLPQGLAVIHGSGDAGSSTVGAGAADASVFSCYLGTTGWIAATLPSAVEADLGVFNLRHPNGSQTIAIGAMRTTGGNISWLLDAFSVTEDRYAHLQQVAAQSAVGSGGLFYLPYLQGERMPFNDPHARGAFIGLKRDTTQAEIFRSVIEGVAYGFATIYEVLKSRAKEGAITMVASGGGAENELLMQTLADVLGTEVVRLADASNAGVRGNVVIASNAMGWKSGYALDGSLLQQEGRVYPDADRHAYHRRALEVFKGLYRALRVQFDEIARL